MKVAGKAIVSTVIELCVNVGLPYLVYVTTQARIGQVPALLAASAPPILWSLIEFLRKRRIDAVSLIVLAGIFLSLIAFFGGGSARFLQLRENLVTGVIGVAFLVSAALGRPLIYQLALAQMSRKSEVEAGRFQALRDKPGFRRTMMVMTLVWGFGLLLQTAVACVLVFQMSIARYLLVSPFVGYGMIGCLILWTFWYGSRAKKRGAALAAQMRAQSEAEAQEQGANT
jgi:hypothetical protein